MNRWFGVALAVAAVAIGIALYGWKGAILALSLIVFWLLLQFSQLMKVMRTANESPLGHVSSALMLQSRLHPGMTLVQLIRLCRSLGVKVAPDTYRWADAGGDAVEVVLKAGKVTHWTLIRAQDDKVVDADATETPSPDGLA
ncbi:hypothetical protein [Roseateles depolymerans]|uniref:Uncharacterized protein n=1 Tax=Roseateles depolymerans TaxID=76731 RepID=A0A0U3M838_9BURK|nr:hypothetical protein [Roseateles depolymerans]ALV04749.1 hypothetical protein RD2015_246 [Roseateles depolymerans]REG15240.1 hypothetical protein DES44_3746 [Roseateles depolymerans]